MPVCVYCGKNQAETQDEIPSRNLFKGIAKLDTYKIPSCRECNEGFSKDEEFLRNLITTVQYGKSLSAAALFEGAVARSMRERPALGRMMMSKMELVDLYIDGIYVGRRTRLEISPDDKTRIRNVLDKYVKGLFFIHFDQPIPSDWIIKHRLLCGPDASLPKKVQDGLALMRWERKGEGIFTYAFNSVPHTHQSVWLFGLFQLPVTYTFVIDPDTAARTKAKRS